MEQRRLRLGDTLDDYCPRERRVTNHAVVAMIEDDIKQTRCTTCDTEHPYKGAKVPRRRKKETPAALYKDVLAGMPETESAPILTGAGSNGHAAEAMDDDHDEVAEPVKHDEHTDPVEHVEHGDAGTPAPALMASNNVDDHDEAAADPALEARPVEDGPVHRPLIRATLPRPEGFQKEARAIPEFTVRQPGNGRGGNGNFRGGDSRMRPGHGGGDNRGNNGARFGGHRQAGQGGGRGAGGRSAGGRGGPSAGGFRGNQGQPRQGGGGRKRSR